MNKILILLIFYVFGLHGLAIAKPNAMPQNTVGLNTIHIANNYIGFGAFYERSLMSNGRLSVIVPLSMGWEFNSFISDVQTSNKSYVSYIANPGLKFYPFGNRKFFTYAVGVSVFSQMGKASKINGNVPVSGSYEEYAFSTAGLLINNYLNFKLNKNLSFGFEIGIGPSFYNNFKPINEDIVVKGGTLIYQNIAFQIAYQF